MNSTDPFADARRTKRQEKIRSSLGRLADLSIPTLERKVKLLQAKRHQFESEQLLAVAKEKEKLVEGKRALEESEQKKARIKRIDQEIASIRSDPNSTRKAFLRPKVLTPAASSKIEKLYAEQGRLEGELMNASGSPLLGLLRFNRETGLLPKTVEENQRHLARLNVLGDPKTFKANPQELSGHFYQDKLREDMEDTQYALELCLGAIKAKGERMARLEAIAAQAAGVSRRLAKKLSNQIKVTEICPYCGGSIVDNPELDHIHPVSKGGLSVESNLVYVCKECNQRKGTMTLASFINAAGLDRSAVENRLREHGKEY